MSQFISTNPTPTLGLPAASPGLLDFGLKFTGGGAQISRTMMLSELEAVLAAVPQDGASEAYRDAILQNNVLGKTTDSTRQQSLRHLRELYALDEETPIFKLLRLLHSLDPASLPLVAMLVAWSRDPLLRSLARAQRDCGVNFIDAYVPSSLGDGINAAEGDRTGRLPFCQFRLQNYFIGKIYFPVDVNLDRIERAELAITS